VDILRGDLVLSLPDSVHVMTDDMRPHCALSTTDGVWSGRGAEVSTVLRSGGLHVRATSGPEGLSRIVLRWRRPVSADALILGDAWERSYGDLQWRTVQPERVLPWYVLVSERPAGATMGWGVCTRPGAFCSWTVDEDGLTLWADVRNGGSPVVLGGRRLDVATVVTAAAATPFAAHRALCAAMSPDPVLPRTPVVGCNNWYYAYGRGFGPDAVLRDAKTVVEYADGHAVRPYCVIDDGWTEGGGSAPGGPWDTGLPGVFDDMREMAERIKEAGARPGLWFRPLLSGVETPATRHGVRRDSGHPLDPSLDAALETVAADVRRFRSWGYELIKHDFSTYDVFGRFAAGSLPELA
jgi:alpha-galactosidase